MKKMIYFATNAYDAIAIQEDNTLYVFVANSEDPLLPRDEDKEAFREEAKAYLIDNADDFDTTGAAWDTIQIEEGADIYDLLGAEEIFAEVETEEEDEEPKYWLDLYDPALNSYYDFALRTVGDNDITYEGRQSDVLESLGISEEEMEEHEDDSFFIDKLDEFFEKELGIKPEEWEVG